MFGVFVREAYIARQERNFTQYILMMTAASKDPNGIDNIRHYLGMSALPKTTTRKKKRDLTEDELDQNWKGLANALSMLH